MIASGAFYWQEVWNSKFLYFLITSSYRVDCKLYFHSVFRDSGIRPCLIKYDESVPYVMKRRNDDK